MMQNNSRSENTKIILGIDPGSRISGYGVICFQDHSYRSIDYGAIRPPQLDKLSERYLYIYNGVEELIEKYKPDALVVEKQFMDKNAQSALKLGMATGAVMIPAKKKGLPIFAYAPAVIKRAVVGNGRASKYQVQCMVQQILRLAALPTPEDAADALALAICHAHASDRIKTEHEV